MIGGDLSVFETWYLPLPPLFFLSTIRLLFFEIGVGLRCPWITVPRWNPAYCHRGCVWSFLLPRKRTYGQSILPCACVLPQCGTSINSCWLPVCAVHHLQGFFSLMRALDCQSFLCCACVLPQCGTSADSLKCWLPVCLIAVAHLQEFFCRWGPWFVCSFLPLVLSIVENSSQFV